MARNEATGRVIKLEIEVLTGMKWNALDRSQWSQYFKTTPKQIVAWIEKAG
jgi:hypothetical protein